MLGMGVEGGISQHECPIEAVYKLLQVCFRSDAQLGLRAS